MHKKGRITFFLALVLLLPFPAFAQLNPEIRQYIVSRSLDMLESQHNPLAQGAYNTYYPPQGPDEEPYQPSRPPRDRDEVAEEYIIEQENKSSDTLYNFIFGNGLGKLSLGFELGSIKGDTKYRISFDNPYDIGGHGESELKWPIDTTLIGLSAALHYKPQEDNMLTHDRFRLSFKWLTKAGKSRGNMKDSDWIENDVGYIDYNDDGVLNGSSAWATNHDGLDIYSESPVKLDEANIFDINYVYNLWVRDTWALGPVLGYHHQSFKFSAYSVNQVGYGPYGPAGLFDQSFQDTRGLKWGEYQASYHVPYLGLNSEFSLNEKLSFLINLGYSPWVRIKDRDSHLYPTMDEALGYNVDMLSPGRSHGKAFLFGSEGSWKLAQGWLLNVGANYISINAKGDLVQQHYAAGVLTGESEPVDEKVKSRYWLINAALQYTF